MGCCTPCASGGNTRRWTKGDTAVPAVPYRADPPAVILVPQLASPAWLALIAAVARGCLHLGGDETRLKRRKCIQKNDDGLDRLEKEEVNARG